MPGWVARRSTRRLAVTDLCACLDAPLPPARRANAAPIPPDAPVRTMTLSFMRGLYHALHSCTIGPMDPEAFFLPDGERLVATELTRGPWGRELMHGGPLAALMARAIEGAA